MISSVDFHDSTLRTSCPGSSRPARRRSPRPSAWAPRSSFLEALGMDRVRAHERELTAYALERLRGRRGPDALRPARRRRSAARSSPSRWTASTRTTSPRSSRREGVCVRAGHHCAQPLMRALGVAATTRASFAVHNTREDVDRLVDGLGARPRDLRGALMDDLYREEILEHYKRPAQLGRDGGRRTSSSRTPTRSAATSCASCSASARTARSQDVRFDGHGCAISQAAASMVSDEVKGMHVDDLVAARPQRSSWSCSASTSRRRA